MHCISVPCHLYYQESFHCFFGHSQFETVSNCVIPAQPHYCCQFNQFGPFILCKPYHCITVIDHPSYLLCLLKRGCLPEFDLIPFQAPNCSLTLRGVQGNVHGQFGTSLSPCPDLNGDGLPELAVGAPLEDRGHGSVYIFLGRPWGIQAKYSQVSTKQTALFVSV